MNSTDKSDVLAEISASQSRVEDYDREAQTLSTYQGALGKIHQVNFITKDHIVIAVTSTGMVSKAESELATMILDKQAEIDAI